MSPSQPNRSLNARQGTGTCSLPGFDKPPARALPCEDPVGFRDAVVEWFDAFGRQYPWRATQDPYAILVSEMMLQQTRIETVLERGYFERWMRRFPSVAELAIASDEEILKLWEGLGYYRRARHLREAARSVVSRHGGVFPQEPSVVRSLPGVGDYTVGAIMAFAFDRAAPMIDGNVARVLARLYDFDESIDDPSGKRRLSEWSGRLTDPGRARRFQSGLMEIGQRLCKVQRPLCWECPVAAFCRTRRPERLPVKGSGPGSRNWRNTWVISPTPGGECFSRWKMVPAVRACGACRRCGRRISRRQSPSSGSRMPSPGIGFGSTFMPCPRAQILRAMADGFCPTGWKSWRWPPHTAGLCASWVSRRGKPDSALVDLRHLEQLADLRGRVRVRAGSQRRIL